MATGSTEVLQLTMTAPTSAEAVRRLDAFSREYLTFRADEVTARAKVLITGYGSRIEELQAQLVKVERQLGVPAPGDAMTDLVSERSKLRDQISDLEATRQDAQLQQSAVVNASKVIESAAPARSEGSRRVVLVLATALIGGAVLGLSIVIFQAILSDRLWLRVEVASALVAPVLLSVRGFAPPSRWAGLTRRLPGRRRTAARAESDRRRLAHVLRQTLRSTQPDSCVAVICLENSQELRFGLVGAAAQMEADGQRVTIVDLTASGSVAAAATRLLGSATDARPEVFRPGVVPSLMQGPADLQAADWDDIARTKTGSGATLVMTDLDPAIGVDYLTAWTDHVLVAVTAGKSSAELVRTAGDLMRTAPLHVHGVVLLHAGGDDVSSGRPPAGRRVAPFDPAMPSWPGPVLPQP